MVIAKAKQCDGTVLKNLIGKYAKKLKARKKYQKAICLKSLHTSTICI